MQPPAIIINSKTKNILNIIKALTLCIVVASFIFPYLDQDYAFVKYIYEAGLLKILLLLTIPLLITYILILYRYDKNRYQKEFPKDKVVFGILVMIVIGYFFYKLL